MTHLLLLPRRKGWTLRACPPWRSRMTQIQALRERRWRRQTTACTLVTCATRSSRRAVRCCGTNMNIQVIFHFFKRWNLTDFWLNESNKCCGSRPMKRDDRNKNTEANNPSWLIIQHFLLILWLTEIDILAAFLHRWSWETWLMVEVKRGILSNRRVDTSVHPCRNYSTSPEEVS